MGNPALLLLVGLLGLALAAALFWPRLGWLGHWSELLHKTDRVLLEDALKHLHDDEYLGRSASLNSLAGALGIPRNRAARLAERLEGLGLIRSGEADFRLTPEGRRYALRVIRIHRLWERYLAEHSGLAQTEWHARAERLEHSTSEEQADALAVRMGHPRYDPHGDPIPTASGEIPPARGRALTSLEPGSSGAVIHVEDEPPAIYAQLVAQGIEPGMRVRLIEADGKRIRLEVEGDECVLAPVVARNVTVTPLVAASELDGPAAAQETLASLAPGERATVVEISRACFGPQRRRLLDLGLLPGTEVEAELASPSGDPVAYRIRGASIALRREQADRVQIRREPGAAGA
jgi:DtxR family Mn-dependent transcriptional regulator